MLNTKNSLLFLFSIFPVSILIGNLPINSLTIIISLIFLVSLLSRKVLFENENKIFYLLIFFFISLLINLAFSNDFYLSLPRIIKVFFLIFFVTSFKYLIVNSTPRQISKIYKVWSIILAIVIIDLLVEYFKGTNILGLSSMMPGRRLGSFTGQESVIGNYFYGFALITLSYIYQNFSNQNFLNLFFAIFFIVISFIIGERANFIKTFIIISYFIFFIYNFELKQKIFSLLGLISLITLFLNFSESYKTRYFNQTKDLFQKNGISKYLDNSQYGAQYNVAKEIFKDNLIFGAGIKNFRVENYNKKYEKLDHKKNHLRIATHPHQVHYEFLSETGVFGYFCFLIFMITSILWSIKSYLKNKNIYQLSGILFIIMSILPLLPTGSFLSTYTSSIFWLNYAIMVGYIKN